jgi:tRNA(Ile2) C34 agmatinyltransferase TiaS
MDYLMVKTVCCESTWHRKSRANYRCNKCGRDVTLEIFLLVQAVEEAETLKSVKQKPKSIKK